MRLFIHVALQTFLINNNQPKFEVSFCASRVLLTHIYRCVCVCKTQEHDVAQNVPPMKTDQIVYFKMIHFTEDNGEKNTKEYNK